MKSLTALLILCFSINGFAAAGLAERFKETLDQYEYSMKVEWDQKDSAFLQQTNENFSATVDDLFLEGLNSTHIAMALKDNKAVTIPKEMNREDFLGWMKNNSNNLYSKGASWDSSVLIYSGLGILVVGFIAYSVWYSSNYKCASWVPSGPRNTCSDWVKK